MMEEFHKAARDAGWTVDDGTAYGPHGAQASLIAGGRGGLPAGEHLCVAGAAEEYDFAFAFAWSESHTRFGVARSALYAPIAVASGAVLPWCDRMRDQAAVWIRVAGGSWSPLDGGTGRDKIPAPSPAIESRTNASLAALIREPSAETVDRAERALRILRDAGWRAARAAREKPGYRRLGAATFRSARGAKHRVEYVLMGDYRLPEGLLWHYELPATAGAPAERTTVLIDTTGVLDLDVPLALGEDRLGTALTVITREADTLRAGGADPALAALATGTSTLATCRKFGSYRVTAAEELGVGFPLPAVSSLDKTVAAVNAEPDHGPSWLALGHAAFHYGHRHVAIAAFARAAELGTGDGTPLLWHALLLHRIDLAAALARLDEAAAVGGVTGPARELQGDLLWSAGDQDAAIAAYGQATEQAPEYVGGWLNLGLDLARCGRVPEAVRVLDEATAIHPTGMVYHFRGYARMLAGDHDGALDDLHEAARRDPRLVTTIVEDPDLAPLRGRDRFDRLPALAAEEEAAFHRRIRDAARPDGPLVPPDLPRATDLGTVVNVLNIGCRRVYVDRSDESVVDQATRGLLDSVGVPFRAGGFRERVRHNALREYRLDDGLDRSWGDRIPAGVGGLCPFGKLDDGGEVALDGQTGEIYRVAKDNSLTWLAFDLETFFLPRCLPDDLWIWRLTADTIHLLDSPGLTGIGAGALTLVAEHLDQGGLKRLAAFLREDGELVSDLRVEGRLSAECDLSGIDLAACCPHLRKLRLSHGAVNESVFRHPALATLILRETSYSGAMRDIHLTAGSRLSHITFEDCLIDADTFRAGPASPLRGFYTSIDQDFGFVFPSRLEFDNCADLSHISIGCEAGSWTLILNGKLPQLREVRQDARPYGSFTSRVVAATPADTQAYKSMIKKGARYAKRW